MINSKQRSKLASMAQSKEASFQIGKNGISDSVIFDLSRQLEAKELVKINLLKNSELDRKAVSEELSEKLGADVVAQLGCKIVLYRKSSKKDFKHILED